MAAQEKLLRLAGDLEHATEVAGDHERLARDLGRQEDAAMAVMHRAVSMIPEGDLDEAEELFDEAERMLSGGSNRTGRVSVVFGRALVRLQRQDLEAALGLLRDCTTMARAAGDDYGLAKSLATEAFILVQQKRDTEALPLAREADRLARDRGHTAMAEAMIAPVLRTLEPIGAPQLHGRVPRAERAFEGGDKLPWFRRIFQRSPRRT
jgi:tetratricopeptide (TPR) repeat protein